MDENSASRKSESAAMTTLDDRREHEHPSRFIVINAGTVPKLIFNVQLLSLSIFCPSRSNTWVCSSVARPNRANSNQLVHANLDFSCSPIIPQWLQVMIGVRMADPNPLKRFVHLIWLSR